LAEIQKPLVSLNRCSLDLGTIYAGVPESIDGKKEDRLISLTNFGNIPAQFAFEERYDSEKAVIRFEPVRGILAPHTEMKVKVSFTVYYGGHVDELLICNVDDYEIPLGIAVTAESFGLNVAFET
jgi:hypothetical protein